jgi:hypothetical protein
VTNNDKSSSFTDTQLSNFFSVSNHRRIPSPFDGDADANDDDSTSVNGNLEIDTMADWFDEEQLDELSHRQPSKYNEAMKFEVRSSSCLSFEF